MTPSERARSLIDVPWAHQGRNIKIAIDCIGLLVFAFNVPAHMDRIDYPRNPVNGELDRSMELFFGPAVQLRTELRANDAVSIGFGNRLRARHVAVVGDCREGGLSLIHTDSKVGRVVEHAIDARWERCIQGIYRLGVSHV